MIQDPSAEAETAYSLFFLTWIDQTLPLCSFIEAYITYVYLPIFHTLTSPSDPPEIILEQSEVLVIALTPCICASVITYNSFPD